MFCAYSKDKEAAQRLADAIKELCDDDERFEQMLMRIDLP
jgi:hypothetical protein